MDKEVFKESLSSIFPVEGYDSECAHCEADDLMVKALEELGYDLSLFKSAYLWYA